MQYLVTMKTIEDKVPSAPQELVPHVERVIRSHEIVVELKKEKKIVAGGMPVGEKAYAFIMDVASNDELNDLLLSIPNFHIMEVDVTPLAGDEGVIAKLRQNLEQMKAAMQ